MKTVVGFLSRPHGYNVLCALIESSDYKLLKVYTHSLKPKSEDSNRSIRYDYHLFVKKCVENNIALSVIDYKNQEITNCPECDYIVEVSWRYLIPEEITKKARISAFGIHRGKLPEYAGVAPVKHALLHGDKEIVISVHSLEPIIDDGSVITIATHPVNYDSSKTLEENIQRLRNEITPLFSKLMFETFNIFVPLSIFTIDDNTIVQYREVSRRDCKFLYDLLADRTPMIDISHKKMPTYREHLEFVLSKPYTKWYIIYQNKEKIGSIYLTKQDEIGIFIKKDKQHTGIGTNALKMLTTLNPRKRYLANINPKNTKSIEFFKKNDFKLIQHTYELSNMGEEKHEKNN